MIEHKQLSPDSVNYTKNNIEDAKIRAKKAQKDLVRETIRARLYGMSYGKFQAEETIKKSDALMRARHEIWKKTQEERANG